MAALLIKRSFLLQYKGILKIFKRRGGKD